MESGMQQRLVESIALFRKKGATSKSKALPLKELGLPLMFKHLMKSPMADELPFVEIKGKYYLDEKRAAEIEENGFQPPGPFRKWAQHTSRVPRGYLRFNVLQLLKEKTLSGSEISTHVENETGGRWKPSPGSLYPLLNKLEENQFIEVVTKDGKEFVDGVKRYRMTELGHAMFDQEGGITHQMRDKLASGPSFPPFFDLPPAMHPVRDMSRRLFEAHITILAEMHENPNPEVLAEFERIIKSTTKKLEKIVTHLEE